MAAIGYLLGALLDPFFMVPAVILAYAIKHRASAFLIVAAVALAEVAIWFAVRPMPGAMVIIAVITRLAAGAGVVWCIGLLHRTVK